jgi:hypothetical protein
VVVINELLSARQGTSEANFIDYNKTTAKCCATPPEPTSASCPHGDLLGRAGSGLATRFVKSFNREVARLLRA